MLKVKYKRESVLHKELPQECSRAHWLETHKHILSDLHEQEFDREVVIDLPHEIHQGAIYNVVRSLLFSNVKMWH